MAKELRYLGHALSVLSHPNRRIVSKHMGRDIEPSDRCSGSLQAPLDRFHRLTRLFDYEGCQGALSVFLQCAEKRIVERNRRSSLAPGTIEGIS